MFVTSHGHYLKGSAGRFKVVNVPPWNRLLGGDESCGGLPPCPCVRSGRGVVVIEVVVVMLTIRVHFKGFFDFIITRARTTVTYN